MAIEPAYPPEPTTREVRSELTRVLSSADFAASPQLSKFLAFVVHETLEGRGAHIKERTIAVQALDRDRTFDPRLDPIVRMAAGKLRKALERYYGNKGNNNRLRIEVPKGG